MLLTYKYRLKNKRSARILRAHAEGVNRVWNYCAEIQHGAYRRWKESGPICVWPSYYTLNALTHGTSEALGLRAQTIQEVCAQFARSRDHRRKCPRFRASSGSRRALGWVPFQVQSRRIDGNSITYFGNTFRWFGSKRRPLPPNVKNGAFVEDASGCWWVVLHVEVENAHVTGAGQIGIDLGLKHLAVMSDGEKIEASQSYRTWETRLATAQRAGNRARARAIHRKIRNVRTDHLHKTSARLAAANRLIVVGDVRPSQLVKTNLAKSIYDAGWSTFRNQLRYKASRHGAVYTEVDEKFTTQTCSRCGDCSSDGRPRGIAGLGIREWRCSSCGATHDRDVNAAKNILALGLSAQPRVDESCEVAA